MKLIYKIFILTTLTLMFNHCGFQPIYSYKQSEINTEYLALLVSENPFEVQETFEEVFTNSKDSTNYQLNVTIKDTNEPILTNSDGTIAKYRTEVYSDFALIDSNTKKVIFSGYTRGFAQYETQANEYGTEEKKREALKIATLNALQSIPIKIQNYQSENSE